MLKCIATAATAILMLFAIACSPDGKKENVQEPAPPAGHDQSKTEAAGTVKDLAIDQRKFVRSGFMEFETPDTKQATRKIEETVNGMGGHILQSHIKMNEHSTVTSAVSTDSVKKLVYYQLQNEMIVRVPDSALPVVLALAEALSRFTIFRNIDAQDVSVQWLSGDMKYNRLNKQVGRRENKPPGEALEEKEENRDEALAAQVQLADEVQFSTVRLNFHQPVQLSVQYLVNMDAQWAKEPGFFKRAGYAFAGGWAKCKDLLVFLTGTWWLLVIFLLLWQAYRKWGKYLKLMAPVKK